MQNGITLIALVISIIVMLILAGVSISAIVGDDGILAKTQYASFINEMAAIEEAVQMWKVNEEGTAIPANGICEQDVVEKAERLKGEIGFYRTWQTTNTLPATSILASASDFNTAFAGEVVYYPAGVQDLYYLNNEGLGIATKKKYLVDAANGMIYSTSGITLNGVRCYSLNMAKAVNGGTIEMPLFASAEVSGAAASGGQALAGNGGTKYVDADGNPIYQKPDGTFVDDAGNVVNEDDVVENENFNENGFKIISDFNNNNLYKLYNSGDLYAKGIKGSLLDTSQDVMANLNETEWRSVEIPTEIGSYKQVIPGIDCVYVIDNNDELWAYGANSSNKFGLSKEQQIEYTGRDPIKLNVAGKKVKKVLSSGSNTYAVTTDNMLYAAGYNQYANLGVGDKLDTLCFMECKGIDHPENLVTIQQNSNITTANIYVCIDETNSDNYKVYFSGLNGDNNFAGDKSGETFLEITRVFDGNIGQDIDQNIKKIMFIGNMITILTKDEKLVVPSNSRSRMGSISIPSGTYKEYAPSTFGETDPIKVKDVYCSYNYWIVIFKIQTSSNQTKYFIYSYDNNFLGVEGSTNQKLYDFTLDLPTSLLASEDAIKKIYVAGGNIFILAKDGKVWATGNYGGLGLGKDVLLNPTGFICLNDETSTLVHKFPAVKGCYYHDDYRNALVLSMMFWEGTDGKIYITGNSTLMFRNNILEQNWIKIASNVKKFNAGTSNNGLAYVDFDNNAWVTGDRSDFLGSETDPIFTTKNFKKLTEIVDTETKGIFENNVKDINVRSGATYVLTLDGKLYVSGQTKTTAWNGNFCIGVMYEDEEGTITEIQKKFKKIKDDVVMMCAHNMITLVVTCTEETIEGSTETEKIYKMFVCGISDGSSLGQLGSPQVLTEITGLPFEVANVKKLYALQRMVYVITNDGKIYTCGQNTTNGYGVNGTGHVVSRLFEQIPESAFDDEEIEDIVFSNSASSSTIALTKNGNLYCWGIKKGLGLGVETTDYILTPQKIDKISGVSSITGGAGYFVLIKDDGTVWGTGSNTYGILGRWIGIDRNSPNSRYKTAFDWVECPELEI